MKIFICLIFLFSFCFCIDNIPAENYGRQLYVNDGVYQDNGRFDDKKDLIENKDPIIRPCALRDIDCIRNVFATNSRCTPTKRPIPDPYKMKNLPLEVPHANLSFVMDIFQFKGLNEWKIEEFYINKETDKLVLEVVFDRIVAICPNATIKFYRKGKEPVEISDYDTIEYNDVSLTLTIPDIKDSIQPSRGHVYAYLPNANPMYTLGSRFLKDKDPDATLAFAEFTLNAALSIREVYVQQGPVIMSIFLQNTICDFGYFPIL